MSSHPIQRRYRAEQLVRARSSDERRRYAASQRQGRIDPNPHQIDAVVFALQRLREGGCILADEVGLGKTIEAGLVIAQLMAESARRILVVLPKALIGQWQTELYTLFGIQAIEASGHKADFTGDGVFLTGREYAGSEFGSALISRSDPFDVCVIDEAHEIFSGIHKRFGNDGLYKQDSPEALTAHRVRQFLGPTPVLLLTATPIQNSLAELWGLVQYIEPTNTLLGSLPTFRDVFCEPGSKDRRLVPEQAHELRRRINSVCQRTLRRQAQEFLEKPFTTRRATLFEYRMSPDERSLYEDVTSYLLEPNLCAFSGKSRQLLLIGFHRRMASSFPALISSLENVAARLQRMLNDEAAFLENSGSGATKRETPSGEQSELLADLELTDDDLTVGIADDTFEAPSVERIAAEMARVQEFVRRGGQLKEDAKADSLIAAVKMLRDRAAAGEGSGKVVIFTESVTTQEYLKRVLTQSNLNFGPEDVTLFRGDNKSGRALQALERWHEEVGQHLTKDQRPSDAVATRLALVHEFKTRSSVFISTEAGAKGLNLQFSDTIINFDLPWNPQRIEQRIGRCHRYGQERDVTVVNFIAADNEAQRLTFQILSEKLDLFGAVLDASDAVLHEPTTDAPEALTTAFGADIETRLQQIYDLARDQAELSKQLKKLSDDLQSQREEFEATQRRMEKVIESRFDDSVKAVFRSLSAEIPETLAELDRDTEQVLADWLEAANIPFNAADEDESEVSADPRRYYRIDSHDALPPEYRNDGVRVAIGSARGLQTFEPLFVGHDLLAAAVSASRTESVAQAVQLKLSGSGQPGAGTTGRLLLVKFSHDGFERCERLIPLMIAEAAENTALPDELALSVFETAELHDAPEQQSASSISASFVESVIEDRVFELQQQLATSEQTRFSRFIDQLERFVEDQAMILRRECRHVHEQLEKATSDWEASTSADVRSRAEARQKKLTAELETRMARLAELEDRTDAHYQKCRDRAYQRRFARPQIEVLIDVEFIVS